MFSAKSYAIIRCALIIVFIIFSSALAQSRRPSHDMVATTQGRATIFEALVEIFRENYWDPSYRDWDAWADTYRDAALNATNRGAFDNVARRMVLDLADDHSNWVGLVRFVEEPRSAVPAQRGLGFQHEHLQGVGIVLNRVYPRTPAQEAGLMRGDVIVAVNGQDVRDLADPRGSSRVFATAVNDSTVTLEVRRRQELLSIDVVPAPVRFQVVQQLPQGKMLDATTGYIYIPTFNSANVGREVHTLVADLQAQGARALVLDLRSNLGGRLSELGLVLGAFVEGTWAQAVSRESLAWESRYYVEQGVGHNLLITPSGERVSELSLESPSYFEGPVAVLVDSRNSSAGEVAPLVLQSMQRATVIGEPTTGNVEAIRGFDLPDGSLVMVAVANMQGVGGQSFDMGVQPDIISSSSIEELARGFDAPVSEAMRVLKNLPFTPGRFF